MRYFLEPHPDLPFPDDLEVEVEAVRSGSSGIVLNYFVASARTRMRVPVTAPSTRADRLWVHTCFEAFVRVGGDGAYCELNFSPSTQWAVYHFDNYRTGMREAEIEPPRIDVPENWDAYQLRASVEGLPPGSVWRLGLCAVIEEKDGRKSYWALAHPPGAPDFHHPDCFALELPAAPAS